MKQAKTFILLIASLGILINSCGRISNQELSEYWWKYGSGHHFGDMIIFTTKEKTDSIQRNWISNDTIYSEKEAFAIVTGTYRKSDGHINLYLEDILTGESATYHGKKKNF